MAATPATVALTEAGISFRTTDYELDADADGYGLGAAAALGVDADAVAKTLVAVLDDGTHVCGVVPVTTTLDLKALARAAGAKRASMAAVADAERITGYVAGGISPLGQRRQLAVFIEELLLALDEVHVSGGRRGLDLALDPVDLVTATAGVTASIST